MNSLAVSVYNKKIFTMLRIKKHTCIMICKKTVDKIYAYVLLY